MDHENLLAGPGLGPVGPPATYLPTDHDAEEALRSGTDLADVAARFPAFSRAWAALAERAFGNGEIISAYAYARVGYHRGLDQLRRAGWRGNGPIPWEHEPNQGFLRSLHMLAVSAAAIGEEDEARRCRDFLAESSPAAAAELAVLARGDCAGPGGRPPGTPRQFAAVLSDTPVARRT